MTVLILWAVTFLLFNPNFHIMQEAYITRINNILAYIDRNLHEELSLQQLAEIAHYSPFHVHRLFKAITHETLLTYITRKRIDHCGLPSSHYSS